MEQNLIRLLKADEIECRVSLINEKGLSLLLYKDARVDQKILDETFGIFWMAAEPPEHRGEPLLHGGDL